MNVSSGEGLGGTLAPGKAQAASGGRHARDLKSGAPAYRFNDAAIGNSIREKWTKDATLKGVTKATYETFGSDIETAIKKSGVRNLLAESGNAMMGKGLTHNLRLGKDTGKAKIEGNPFVGNNNMLETWKTAGTTKPRKIILDASKSAAERRADALKSHISDVDMTA